MLFQILFGIGRMQTYTVHEGPQPASDRVARAEALRFIKDGFALPAFVAGPIWLLAHKLWMAAVAYVAAVALIVAAHEWLGLATLPAIAAMVGLHLLIGFEADTIERANLEQQGWSGIGSVCGTSSLDCERRFIETWLPGQPILAGKAVPHSALAPAEAVQAARSFGTVGSALGATPGTGHSAASAAAGRLAALWRKK